MLKKKKPLTFEEALQHARTERDDVLAFANRQQRYANRKLAESIRDLMAEHGKGVSAATRALGWSRMYTYELCERAGVDIKRTQKSNREETR